jgi:hypothetical protein
MPIASVRGFDAAAVIGLGFVLGKEWSTAQSNSCSTRFANFRMQFRVPKHLSAGTLVTGAGLNLHRTRYTARSR